MIMNYKKYELINKSLSPEAQLIVEMYRNKKLPNKELHFTLEDNMLLSDDDIYELFKTFDLAFQELKDNDIINNYTLKIVNKVIIFKFIC